MYAKFPRPLAMRVRRMHFKLKRPYEILLSRKRVSKMATSIKPVYCQGKDITFVLRLFSRNFSEKGEA
jgi:hypothetical protein